MSEGSTPLSGEDIRRMSETILAYSIAVGRQERGPERHEKAEAAARCADRLMGEIGRLRESRNSLVRALQSLARSIDLPPEALDAGTWEVGIREGRARLVPVSAAADPFPFARGAHVHIYVVGKGR